jgi:hypothetical protein
MFIGKVQKQSYIFFCPKNEKKFDLRLFILTKTALFFSDFPELQKYAIYCLMLLHF